MPTLPGRFVSLTGFVIRGVHLQVGCTAPLNHSEEIAMLVIEVERADVQERTGTRDNGQPWKIRNQVVYAHMYDAETGALKRYPTEVKLRLVDDAKPYQPGFYILSPTSIFSDRYDALAVDAHLVSVDEYMKATAMAISQRIPKEQAQAKASA
jgi:hypothetical protein